jgi:hypothetical protein
MHAHRCAVRRARTDDRRPNARGAIARAFRPPLTRAAVPAKEWAAATRKRCFRCAALLCCASDAALFVSQIDADAAVINAGAEPCTPFRVCHSRCVGSRACIAYCSLCYLWRPCPDALNASRVLANVLAAHEPEIAHAGLLAFSPEPRPHPFYIQQQSDPTDRTSERPQWLPSSRRGLQDSWPVRSERNCATSKPTGPFHVRPVFVNRRVSSTPLGFPAHPF